MVPLNFKTVRGNHDRQMTDRSLEDMGASDRYAAEQLRPEQLEWLAKLPATQRLPDGVMLVHGTPSSDSEYFLETVTDNGLQPATETEVKVNGI